MSKHSRIIIIGTTGLLLSALPALAKKTPKATSTQMVIIQNTGSTNTAGYMIYVSPDGQAESATMPRVAADPPGTKLKSGAVPKAMAKKFFQDLAAAMPLSALPVRHGMRSASFGTQTYIIYQGQRQQDYQRSPDLTFASDPRTVALKADIDAITKTLGVGNAPRHPIVLHLNSANTPGTTK